MNWTHEELKSFPTMSLTGRVIEREFWVTAKSSNMFMNIEVDLESNYVHILGGYFSSGIPIHPQKRWDTLVNFSRETSIWIQVLTPKLSDYDPTQQPYDEDDI